MRNGAGCSTSRSGVRDGGRSSSAVSDVELNGTFVPLATVATFASLGV